MTFLNIATILALSSISTLTLASTVFIDSNIKPIPKLFVGKWAGLHSTEVKLDKQVLKDLCENGGDSDTSYFVEFAEDGLQIQTLVWWVTLSTEYPQSYSQYSVDQISGQSLKSYATYNNEQEINNFNFRIINDKLYDGYDENKIELMRCHENPE